MRTEAVRYFVEVAKSHSIGIVAEKFFMTQPAISIAIKNLEKELDCVLFERSKNGMYLTELGFEIFEIMEKIIREEQEIHTLINKSKYNNLNKLQGTLNIVAAPLIVNSFLQDAIVEFWENNFEIKINVEENIADQIVEKILSNEFDIGLTILADEEFLQLEKNDDIFCKNLFSEKIYVVANKKYGLGQKKSITCNNVWKLPIVVPSFLSLDKYFGTTQENIESTKRVLSTQSFALIKDMIDSGRAVGIFTSSAVTAKFGNNDHVDIIPISDMNYGNVCYLYHKNSENEENIKVFIEALLRYC